MFEWMNVFILVIYKFSIMFGSSAILVVVLYWGFIHYTSPRSLGPRQKSVMEVHKEWAWSRKYLALYDKQSLM